MVKIQKLFPKIIFPIILFIYPLYGFNLGADLSDTTYSLGNYMYFDSMTGSWKYATFLSNLLGAGLLKLAGNKMILMTLFCGMVISATALAAYLGLSKIYNPAMVFIGEIIAICMTWCPNVILYNYLTYLLLTLAALVLYKAIIADSKKLYILAGAILGLNVFVRVSNLVEVALILAVWYGAYLNKKKPFIPTLYCIIGYIAGLATSVLIVVIAGGTKGIGECVSWMLSLSSSEGDAGGYSLTEMVRVIFDNYLGNVKYFAISILGIALGFVGFRIFKGKLLLLKRGGYIICLAGLFYYFYRNGVFTTKFYNNGAIFGLCVLAIFWQFVAAVYALFSKDLSVEDKTMAAIVIVLLLITPLGSNNHLFTIINSMFISLPYTVGFGYKVLKDKKEVFPIASYGAFLLVVLLAIGIMFNLRYVFVDGEQGTGHDTVISESKTMKGMKTDTLYAEDIDELCIVLSDYRNKEAIFYGNVPGASYLLEMPCAISTSWPDLDSYSEKNFEKELNEVSKVKPLIIMKMDAYSDIYISDTYKDKTMLKYIFENDYEPYYMNADFMVLASNEE